MGGHRDFNSVGPVFIAGELTDKILFAIKKNNRNVNIQDFGSYVRVLVPKQCILKIKDIQKELDSNFKLPEDLEIIMPSFKGKLIITDTEITWSFNEKGTHNDK